MMCVCLYIYTLINGLGLQLDNSFSDSRWCAEVVCPTMSLCYGVSSGYRNPPVCLPCSVCGEGAAGRVFVAWWTALSGFPACRLGSALRSFGLCGGRVIKGSRLFLGVWISAFGGSVVWSIFYCSAYWSLLSGHFWCSDSLSISMQCIPW